LVAYDLILLDLIPSLLLMDCSMYPVTQQHSLQCSEVKEKTKVEGRYQDIFEEDILSDISKTMLGISKLREDLS
jgi:hypothetical protein